MKYVYYYIDDENYLIKSIETDEKNPVIVANQLRVDDVYPTYEWAAAKFKEELECDPEEARWSINEYGEVEPNWEDDTHLVNCHKEAHNWFDDYDKAQQAADEIKEIFRKYNPNKPYEQ